MGNVDSKTSGVGATAGNTGNNVKPSSEHEGTEASTDGSASHKEELNGQSESGGMVKRKGRGKLSSKFAGSRSSQPSKENGAGNNHQVQTRDDEHTAASLITDDQVQVNLAMSDLMAYLQVVANNSSNLPITKRDDLELDRFVTSLSPEEYARKAAAFVPADVRMIGGTFTRYGRVWDLPTSEVSLLFRPRLSLCVVGFEMQSLRANTYGLLYSKEFNAVDGAQEPGKSYGGACVNSLLKVLYDAANDQTDRASAEEKGGDALFDDDEDDESDEEGSTWGKSFKSTFSIEANTSHSCSISWNDLLRKMSAEMKDIEYAQAPKVTSSRKLDLSRNFSLVGENFDPKLNQKRSLLIGCNYRNSPGAELKASHDDIRSMKVRYALIGIDSFSVMCSLALILHLFCSLLVRTILLTYTAFPKARET
jgi:hypothetical protein